MKPIDIRNENWTTLRDQLAGRLRSVYHAWVAFGPATTRQLATASQIDILNVRPRTTDLVDLGLVELIENQAGEGVYRARRQDEWEAWANDLRHVPAGQLSLI